MPYISANHSLKIDLSAHNFSEPFTENRILLLHFQWIHSLKINSSAQSFSEPFTENSFYALQHGIRSALHSHVTKHQSKLFWHQAILSMREKVNKANCSVHQAARQNEPRTACSHHHPSSEDETFRSRNYSSNSSSSSSSSKWQGHKWGLQPVHHRT